MHQLPALQSALLPIKSVVETETKLSVEPDFRLPPLSGRPLPRRVFTSTYFDTLDHCLARSNITLRCRIEKGAVAWQLKLPLDGTRREIELRDATMTPPAPKPEPGAVQPKPDAPKPAAAAPDACWRTQRNVPST